MRIIDSKKNCESLLLKRSLILQTKTMLEGTILVGINCNNFFKSNW